MQVILATFLSFGMSPDLHDLSKIMERALLLLVVLDGTTLQQL